MGTAQLKSDDAAAAFATFEKGVAVNPDDADLQFNLGVAAAKAAKPLVARSAFMAYMRLRPDATDRATVQGFVDAFNADLQQ